MKYYINDNLTKNSKKKQAIYICNRMDKFQNHHALSNKAGKKVHIFI